VDGLHAIEIGTKRCNFLLFGEFETKSISEMTVHQPAAVMTLTDDRHQIAPEDTTRALEVSEQLNTTMTLTPAPYPGMFSPPPGPSPQIFMPRDIFTPKLPSFVGVPYEQQQQLSIPRMTPVIPVRQVNSMVNSSPGHPVKLGLSSEALSHLMVGRKTVDARLNYGIVSRIQVGWNVRFECGPQFQDVTITGIQAHPSFKILLEKEGHSSVSPWASTLSTALAEFTQRHGSSDMEHSVVALRFNCRDVFAVTPIQKKQPSHRGQSTTTTLDI